jgi:hypothetical protein
VIFVGEEKFQKYQDECGREHFLGRSIRFPFQFFGIRMQSSGNN